MIRACLFFLTCLSGGCGTPTSSSTHYQLQFDVVDDRGEALAGVAIAVGDTKIGTTDGTGILRAEVNASKGDRYPLHRQCPEQYESSSEVENIVFRDTKGLKGGEHAKIHVRLQCERQERVAALLVHADGRVGLPVLIDGVEHGRTGPGGFAHIRLDMRPGAQFQVHIDSSERPSLRPVDPRRTMTVGSEDGLFVFDPVFSEVVAQQKIRRRRRVKTSVTPVPKKTRPVRID